MKRKQMTMETIPSKKTTHGGNGSYMRRAKVRDKATGGHKLSPNMVKNATATGKPALKQP